MKAHKPSRVFLMRARRTALMLPWAALLFAAAGTAAGIDTVRSPVFNRSGTGDMVGALGNTIDSHIQPVIHPAGGIFNKQPWVTFGAPEGIAVYYTFDPLIPPEWFNQYSNAVVVPAGMNSIRYYGKDGKGRMSAVQKETFTVDTVPPKIHLQVSDGANADTLRLLIKKTSTLYYTLDGSDPTRNGQGYRFDKPDQQPMQIVIPHQGRAMFKAIAWDDAGNQSNPFIWTRQYNAIGPQLTISPNGGLYNKKLRVMVNSTIPAKIYYTFDSTVPDQKSMLYLTEGIPITREGNTFLRCRAQDEAGTWSPDQSARFVIDFKAPRVHSRLLPSSQADYSNVELWTDQPATVYYEIGGAIPTVNSPVYGAPFAVRNDQVFSYFVTDMYGNISQIFVVDELKKPKVHAVPDGGVFNRKLSVDFKANVPGTVYWRMLPDTNFAPAGQSIAINEEGLHTIEYYLKTIDGTPSLFRRSLFITDWTPPRVSVEIEKKTADSLFLIFRCTKNATICYTTDGSDPHAKGRARMTGDKHQSSWGRIMLSRARGIKLAFFAEDLAGNQSGVKTIDFTRPQTFADVPCGREHLYNKILSISLITSGNATIHYARHGRGATVGSPVFTAPINLVASDTIVAMAVDASGIAGTQDTFIYRIDLPPSAHFLANPDTLFAGTSVIFNASSSIDNETPFAHLKFRWDFDGHGVFKGKGTNNPTVSHLFSTPGRYAIDLEVTDDRGNIGTFRRNIIVNERCPEGMVSIAGNDGRAVCIDKYEYPNTPGKLPRTQVSWVEAKIACIDAGKRLCARNEWESACRSGSDLPLVYPYGNTYARERCPTELKKIAKSGTFDRCSRNGVYDMVGNAWEWVEDKNEEYPLMVGGSYTDGKDAHCGLAIPGTMGARAEDVGFRCCK